MYKFVSKYIYIYMISLLHRLPHRYITKTTTDLTHTHTLAEFRCLRAHITQMDFSWLPEDNRYSTKPVDKLIDLIRDNRIESSAFIEEADENAVCVAFVF